MLYYYEMQEENKSTDSTIKLLASWTTSQCVLYLINFILTNPGLTSSAH